MTTNKDPFSTVSAVFAFRKFNVKMPVQTRQVIRLSSLSHYLLIVSKSLGYNPKQATILPPALHVSVVFIVRCGALLHNTPQWIPTACPRAFCPKGSWDTNTPWGGCFHSLRENDSRDREEGRGRERERTGEERRQHFFA